MIPLDNHIAFVATDSDRVIAWVHAYKTITIESLPFVELAGLVVNESYRSKGIGKMMIDQIKE
ncbi:MAG: hypothetical protein C4329_02080 [Chitinophagaceae bacterium]